MARPPRCRSSGIALSGFCFVLFLFTVCDCDVRIGICDAMYKDGSEGTIHSPDYPELSDIGACECNLTATRETYVQLQVHFLSDVITHDEKDRCQPIAQVGLFWECPNVLVPGTPDDAYMDSSTTVYLEDSSSMITLGIQNPRSSNFRMQITFNTLFNRIIHIECGPAPVILPVALAATSGNDVFSTGGTVAGVVILFFLVVVVVAVGVYFFCRRRGSKERNQINKSRDNYDDTRGDNQGYEGTPKSSIYNISIDDSFSVERGPEAVMENPPLVGQGMTLPFKYSQVSLASRHSQGSGKIAQTSNRSPNVSMDPAVLPVTMQPSWQDPTGNHNKGSPTGNTNHSNSTSGVPLDDIDNNNDPTDKPRQKNVTFLNPAFNNPDHVTPQRVEPITAAPQPHEPRRHQLRRAEMPPINQDTPPANHMSQNDPPANQPYQSQQANQGNYPLPPANQIPDVEDSYSPNKQGGYQLPPANQQPDLLEVTPPANSRPPNRQHFSPIKQPLVTNQPMTNQNPTNHRPVHNLPPGHPARAMSPAPSSGRNTPMNGTPTKYPMNPVMSPHRRQLSPSDDGYYPDSRASPLTLPLPYMAPVIPLGYRKSFNASEESIPYIDQSGLDMSLRRF